MFYIYESLQRTLCSKCVGLLAKNYPWWLAQKTILRERPGGLLAYVVEVFPEFLVMNIKINALTSPHLHILYTCCWQRSLNTDLLFYPLCRRSPSFYMTPCTCAPSSPSPLSLAMMMTTSTLGDRMLTATTSTWFWASSCLCGSSWQTTGCSRSTHLTSSHLSIGPRNTAGSPCTCLRCLFLASATLCLCYSSAAASGCVCAAGPVHAMTIVTMMIMTDGSLLCWNDTVLKTTFGGPKRMRQRSAEVTKLEMLFCVVFACCSI